VALLDLDGAAVGAAAQDIGNFIAHLETAALAGTFSERWVEPLTESLLRGYGATPRISEAAKLWSVASLLRLAAEPFRTRQSNWAARIEAILHRAESLFASVNRERPRSLFSRL